MGTYTPQAKYKWKAVATREGNWKAGMLVYRAQKPAGLSDLHIIASKPSHIGCYSDAHVTFVENGGARHHVYYQVNNGKLVADYVLAPKGWRATFWIKYPSLREETETEVLHFVAFWREEGRLDDPPSAVD